MIRGNSEVWGKFPLTGMNKTLVQTALFTQQAVNTASSANSLTLSSEMLKMVYLQYYTYDAAKPKAAGS
jgi:hypothetical protein